jgi:hypothetical protein
MIGADEQYYLARTSMVGLQGSIHLELLTVCKLPAVMAVIVYILVNG